MPERQTGHRPSEATIGRAVSKWREAGTTLGFGKAGVTADVDGVLWADGQAYPRSMTVSVLARRRLTRSERPTPQVTWKRSRRCWDLRLLNSRLGRGR